MPGMVRTMAAAGHTAATEVPPSGPPTNPSLYFYGGGLIGVQWTNGDPLASTQLGQSDFDSVDPTTVFTSASPGATQKQTGESDQCPYWFVRHSRNGQETDWVLATDSNDREDCLL